MVTDKITTQTSLMVSSSTFIGGVLSLSDVAMIIGIIGTLATVLLTWRYKKRADDRDSALHVLEMQIRQTELSRLQSDSKAELRRRDAKTLKF